jgi:hypothetical protein
MHADATELALPPFMLTSLEGLRSPCLRRIGVPLLRDVVVS